MSSQQPSQPDATTTPALQPAAEAAPSGAASGSIDDAALSAAPDLHSLIRVVGARQNNLKNISLDLPKRQITVFTGVSGSGKTSLVFDTIAAESRRLVNETYSMFVQGFMPNLARPDVDLLEGLTTAIIVDQQRLGGDPRSTVGTATDTYAMLRVLFSRIGQPQVGPPNAFSFNVPPVTATGTMTIDKAGGKTVKANFSRAGGMCPRCEGRGAINDFDPAQLLDQTKSLAQGAFTIPGYKPGGWNSRLYAESGFFDPDKPIAKYTSQEMQDLLFKEPTRIKLAGINMTYEGLVGRLRKSMLAKDPESMQPHIKAFVERAVTFTKCPVCLGTRLNPKALSAKIAGQNIAQLSAMELSDLATWFNRFDHPQVRPLLVALRATLAAFVQIGLGYLALDRPAASLSGGEAQRLKKIRHFGSSLTDVTYVFDEPTIGLHPHDIERMSQLLRQLRDKSNTVLVVEHEPEIMAIADHLVDLGPKAGSGGGQITYQGSHAGLRASGTITGRYLDQKVSLKATVRTASSKMTIKDANTNNLQNITVDIPLGVLVVLTGVAGSGKSSLMRSLPPEAGAVLVDQTGIKGSRRSNPATFTGLLDSVR
ncbi:MAG: excinuclease ABC subunit UvrA, partial [Micrococcales bacterium]|nr:excinuclease ABC subunit UvrA [Micrococcales bacterium]